MTELFYGIGDLFTWIFQNMLEPLGNLPNWGLIALAFVLLGWWLKLQKKYNDKAASDPDQLK